MSDKQKKINYLISTVRVGPYEDTPVDEYLSFVSDLLCQFDTDIAIAVMEGLEDVFGEDATYQATAIKVNYGY